jgi:general secretion pathway protein G
LATVVLPKVLGGQDKAMVAKAKSDVRALSSSIKMFKLDNFKYPNSLNELTTGGSTGKGYIDVLPKDPWGKDYQYSSAGSHLEFDVWSTGTGDSGKQIGNWNLHEIK